MYKICLYEIFKFSIETLTTNILPIPDLEPCWQSNYYFFFFLEILISDFIALEGENIIPIKWQPEV